MTTVKDLFPQFLHTPRLTLELFNYSDEHYQLIIDTFNTPSALRDMGDFDVTTKQHVDAFISRARVHDPRFGKGVADADICYCARLGAHNPKGELVGIVSLAQRAYEVDSETRLLPPDMGWQTLEKYMGKGYTTEMAKELFRFVGEDFGLNELVAFAGSSNPASNRVAEKVGFINGGEVPDLDNPGSMLGLRILPGMPRIDQLIPNGIRFTLD